MTLSPEEQLDVLARIWDRGEQGYVFLPWIPGTAASEDARKRSWKESRAFQWPDDRSAILEHLRAREGDELYFTPNKFLGESRKADLTAEETALYADLDEADPEFIEEELRPSIAWQSSPNRYQAVWLLKGFHTGASERGGLNHRMSVHVDADPSGWDSTQLLRVPGRPNYKPKYRENGKPAEGRLLWSEDRVFDSDYLDGLLPVIATPEAIEDVEEQELDLIDRHEVWARVRLKCSPQVREFMAMKRRDIEDSNIDRSETIWAIAKDLARAGCTISEIVAIIRPTGWNKYDGRNNELSQLRNDVYNAKAAVIAQGAETEEQTLEDAAEAALRPASLTWLADVTAQPMKRPAWLIRKIWAKHSVGFISGEPKSYKSYFGLDMAVSLALGVPFLGDDQFSCAPGCVLYLQEEDSMPIVLHRLAQIVEEKAPDRFWRGQLTMLEDSPSGRVSDAQGRNWTLEWTPPVAPIPLALHVRTGFVASDPAWHGWLAEMVQEHKIDLVVIDTLSTTMGQVELKDSVAMNAKILRPLKQIADVCGTAIAIVHHSRKATGTSVRAGQDMMGSVAIHAWVESALYLRKDEPVTGKPTQIKVERENKLDGDMKFRVRIPYMFEEGGDREDGARQLWQPEVIMGWAEDTEAEQAAAKEVAPRQKYKGPGGKVAQHVIEKMSGPKNRPRLLDEIIQSYGQNRGNTLNQLQRAVENGLLEGDELDGWVGL